MVGDILRGEAEVSGPGSPYSPDWRLGRYSALLLLLLLSDWTVQFWSFAADIEDRSDPGYKARVRTAWLCYYYCRLQIRTCGPSCEAWLEFPTRFLLGIPLPNLLASCVCVCVCACVHMPVGSSRLQASLKPSLELYGK